jgi:hypothetical protein
MLLFVMLQILLKLVGILALPLDPLLLLALLPSIVMVLLISLVFGVVHTWNSFHCYDTAPAEKLQSRGRRGRLLARGSLDSALTEARP